MSELQESLPVSVEQINMKELMAEVTTMIGEDVIVNGAIEYSGVQPLLICGRVGAINFPNATVIVATSGVVADKLVAKRLINFGRIDPVNTSQERLTVCSLEIIAAQGSVMSACDVYYDHLQTHSGAKMPKVLLEETAAGPTCERL